MTLRNPPEPRGLDSARPDTGRDPSGAALDPRMRTAIIGVAAIGAMFAIGAIAGWGTRAGVSVAVGGLIAVANLYGLARIVSALLGARVEENAGAEPGSGIWGLFAILKVIGLFGGVWLLLGSHLVDPIGLIVGWGALPIGVSIGSFLGDKGDRSMAPRAKEAPPAGPPAP
jgi:ATP synthase I chain